MIINHTVNFDSQSEIDLIYRLVTSKRKEKKKSRISSKFDLVRLE